METNYILLHLFLIFTGAAVLSTAVLYTRQSLLIAYILLGVLLGPWGLRLVPEAGLAKEIGDVGIILLLFLIGLELNPRDLFRMLRKISWIAFVTSVTFLAMGMVVAYHYGFSMQESLLVGATLMFSSTIIGLKLLPSTTLHHQRIGEVMVSILLMQDLIAIVVLLVLHGLSNNTPMWQDIGLAFLTLPTLLIISFAIERYLLRPLLTRFERVQEYVFLVAMAWCLGMAKLASKFGLSHEIGAFMAGVAIAEGPIAHYMADNLKPIRDFCLVMFFFTVGARFNVLALPQVIIPAIMLTLISIIIKPVIFSFLFKKAGESSLIAREAGVRLGQTSEFSLLIGAMAIDTVPQIFRPQVNYLIQATTMLTIIASCYWVVLRYPTPVSFKNRLQKD